MPKTADDIFKDKIKLLFNAEKNTDKGVVKFQQKLFQILASEYLPRFAVDADGFVLDNVANASLISSLDSYFDELASIMTKDVLSVFVKGLLEGAVLSADYYIALGFESKLVQNILDTKVTIETKLGITPKGRLKKNGYLQKLGRTEAVRQRLKDYVISSLTGDTSFLDFQLGFRNLVIGNKRVKGLPTTGVLQRYFDQFAYDSFNAVDASVNNQFAKELNLTHFTYEGSLIASSRRFCEKRAGQAFKVSDTLTWKDDPDLIDKKTKDSYNPLVDRGRYRCRHFIKYITKELYNALKGITNG